VISGIFTLTAADWPLVVMRAAGAPRGTPMHRSTISLRKTLEITTRFRHLHLSNMRRLLPILAALAALTTAPLWVSEASADRSSLGLPRILLNEPALPKSVIGAGFFAAFKVGGGIFDLRAVQEHPEMKARRDYSLMAALPTRHTAPAAAMPLLSETRQWKVSDSLRLTFPLAITGRNLVTAEIAGAGQVAVAPHGMAKGGVVTFSTSF
jgi:hypothetical protein